MSQPAPRRDFRIVDAVVVPRRSRLRTGFHRLGLLLAVPTGLLSFVAFGIAIAGNPADPVGAILFGVAIIILAAAIYACCRLLAWVIAGFLGD